MFDSLLIANRGEIACRIIKTARRMGLRTVAVYSDADRDALHVQMADQAVRIGPAPAADSYLRTGRILDAARKTGAQAIHPGYGFLSEQPDLIQGCSETGIIWVGPHLDAITSMGSKIEAKQIAQEAGVPCIPGYSGLDQSDDTLIHAALEIGLPVMVKASAGGGGKGMRAVFEKSELAAAVSAARTEAKRSFGDDRLLIEKLIQNPRHIEVQLLGDKHGTMLHLFERDCSVQRNHQKLLEEAPAPNLRNDTREALYAAAVKLGRKIGYDSTGTVEFIMDAATESFYFLEMNTRLQVEHTVTEEITGLDLVEQQLRVAVGQALTMEQDQITCTGHAIEARLTAEDASDNFRPETGTILHWNPGPELRSDSGIQTGSVVGSSYDSMIAKLIAYGDDREMACQKLSQALEQLEICGLATTRLFLRDAIRREKFANGQATTDFLPQEWPEGWHPPEKNSLSLAVLAFHCKSSAPTSPWQSTGSFRLLQNAGHPAQSTYVDIREPESRMTLASSSDGLVLNDGTQDTPVHVEWTGPRRLTVTRDGVHETVGALVDGNVVHVWGPEFDAVYDIVSLGDFDPAQLEKNAASPDRITAPMPGLIVELRVEPGAVVAEGDTLAVMESMKLLMELKAAASGTVVAVKSAVGNTVDAGTLLIQLDISTKGE
ncbi:acetyl/propionyl/methylcrotonyl-CoA carboxylase subunit alpha [Ruegeria lacuscaerulensis]|uniref:acetyl/propionyl/methylcrotonyl-CoA carboxylase subunit alpha n=1 Tax=Ruegeria lacuscaerulensis TaxID=55218 RepID=UPI00147D9515|nr:biotin carboxylase N-terminal domain-containing protein [Ruegeria lacuscaerulensis]